MAISAAPTKSKQRYIPQRLVIFAFAVATLVLFASNTFVYTALDGIDSDYVSVNNVNIVIPNVNQTTFNVSSVSSII